MLGGMKKLQHLTIGFVENYIGDEGLSSLTETISSVLPNLKTLSIDLAFNDAKGYGGIAAVKHLSKLSLDSLDLRLSHNEFRDHDVKLMIPHFKTLIANNGRFNLDFMETAVSRVLVKKLQSVFDQHDNAEIAVNSVIPEEEQQKAEGKAPSAPATEAPATPKKEENTQEAQLKEAKAKAEVEQKQAREEAEKKAQQ